MKRGVCPSAVFCSIPLPVQRRDRGMTRVGPPTLVPSVLSKQQSSTRNSSTVDGSRRRPGSKTVWRMPCRCQSRTALGIAYLTGGCVVHPCRLNEDRDLRSNGEKNRRERRHHEETHY